jgi:2'-hydroxyisoflavone reductase
MKSRFSRAASSATKVNGVEHIIADREGDMSMLSRRTWDAVLDNNARDYRWVQRSTQALKDSTAHYLFVSSISAYQLDGMSYAKADQVRMEPLPDTHALFTPPATFKDGDEAPYGLTKAMSERLVHAAFPGRATIVRPGLIVGPTDPTDRFTYWPVRVDEGGEVLAPGNPAHSSQVIDQRDLTEWLVRLAEDGTKGDFNATGPASRLTFAEKCSRGVGRSRRRRCGSRGCRSRFSRSRRCASGATCRRGRLGTRPCT